MPLSLQNAYHKSVSIGVHPWSCCLKKRAHRSGEKNISGRDRVALCELFSRRRVFWQNTDSPGMRPGASADSSLKLIELQMDKKHE